MRVFFDCEFTGLHKQTSLISLGCVTEDGRQFYAELIDYDQDQVDEWIKENVISKLHLRDLQNSEYGFEDHSKFPRLIEAKGPKDFVRMALGSWLADYDQVEMWGDVLAYDWMLMCNLFGGAMNMPENIYYIPFDVATLLKAAGIDPDQDRQSFWEGGGHVAKHDALWDAYDSMQAYGVGARRISDMRTLGFECRTLIAHIQAMLNAVRYPDMYDLEKTMDDATKAWKAANQLQLHLDPGPDGKNVLDSGW